MYKRYYKKYGNKLACFSPPVMLATFLIELGLALYVIWRYKLNTLEKLATTMLFSLAIFQLSEFMICGGLGIQTADWSRIGYVSITFMPAVGLHMIATIIGKNPRWLLRAAYGSAGIFAAFFLLVPGAINIAECRPNYAVFDVSYMSVKLYALHYYAWLFTGIFYAWNQLKSSPKHAKALYGMIAGYLVFLVPTTVINFIDPETVAGIPSIMCGFAVIFAVLIVGVVLPQAGLVKNKSVQRIRKARNS